MEGGRGIIRRRSLYWNYHKPYLIPKLCLHIDAYRLYGNGLKMIMSVLPMVEHVQFFFTVLCFSTKTHDNALYCGFFVLTVKLTEENYGFIQF